MRNCYLLLTYIYKLENKMHQSNQMMSKCKVGKHGIAALFFGLVCNINIANADEPLVAIADVKAWEKGQIEVINCVVSSPYLKVFSSENNAKLTTLLPKGSHVKKGQLVAKQQDYYLQQELTRLREERAIHQAELNFNRTEFQRLLALKNVTSEVALESARSQMLKSNASYQKVLSKIEEMEYRLSKLQFFAPEDGTIVDTFSTEGEFLNKGIKILSFLSQEDKELSCQLPAEQYVNSERLTFRLTDDFNTTLNALRVEQTLDASTQLTKVHLKSSGSLAKFFLGQRVKVELQINQPSLTKLPADSLMLSQSGNYVWKVNNQGIVSKVDILVKSNFDDYFVVESKLQPGDKVVTTGKSRLRPLQKVNPKSLDRAI